MKERGRKSKRDMIEMEKEWERVGKREDDE